MGNEIKKIKTLIVSSEEKSVEFIRSCFNGISNSEIKISAAERDAEKELSEREFDIVIINSPLEDGSGKKLAALTAKICDAQILLIVKKDLYNNAVKTADENGYFCVSKPMSKDFLSQTIRLLSTMAKKVKKMEKVY